MFLELNYLCTDKYIIKYDSMSLISNKYNGMQFLSLQTFPISKLDQKSQTEVHW